MTLVSRDMLISLREGLHSAGFDLVQHTGLATYNRQVESKYRLPDFGRPNPLVVVVANTKEFWSDFLEKLESDGDRRKQADPLDTWVEELIAGVVGSLQVESYVAFAHDVSSGTVAIQRLGELAGVGHVGPCQLSIHRLYGPWFSYRAAIVLDVPSVADARAAIDTCEGCHHKPCMAAQQAVLKDEEVPSFKRMRSHWEGWLAIREACPVGRGHEFTHSQAAYHYTHNSRWLEVSLDARS